MIGGNGKVNIHLLPILHQGGPLNNGNKPHLKSRIVINYETSLIADPKRLKLGEGKHQNLRILTSSIYDQV